MSDVLDMHLSDSSVECLVDFFEALRRGSSKNLLWENELDILHVFRRLEKCMCNDGEDYSCLGVTVPRLVRLDLCDAFRDIAIYCEFQKNYKKEVLDVFWSVIDVLILTLN